MSLRRIERVLVENWRNWLGEAEVGGPGAGGLETGVVVLAGPNAVGKSGLREAIVDGLLDRHWGTHTDHLRPAGTKGVLPRVVVEFQAGAGRFRIEKVFGSLKDKASFWEWHGGEWVLRDQGEEAYLLCRGAVLGAEEPCTPDSVPSRGGPERALADTLMEVLLPSQGSLVSQPSTPESVANAVTDREAATATTRLDRVLRAVSAEADGIWVGKRDRPKKGSELQAAEARLLDLEREIEPLQRDGERIGELVRELAEASEQAAEQPDAAAQARETGRLQQEAAEHRQKREAARTSLEEGNRELEQARELSAGRKTLLEALSRVTTRVSDATAALEKHRKKLESAEALHREHTERRRRHSADIRAHLDWIAYENRETELLQLRRSLKAVNGRITRIEEQERILAEKTVEARSLLVPTSEEWVRLDDLRKELQRARGRLDADAWTVSGSIPSGIRLRVDGDEVGSTDPELPATREVVVSDAEGNDLRVRAPEGVAGEVARREGELAEFLRAYGVSDDVELRRRNNYLKQEVKPAISKALSRKEDALAGATRSDLLGDRLDLERGIEAREKLAAPGSPRPEGTPPDWAYTLKRLQAEEQAVETRATSAGHDTSVAGERVSQAEQECQAAEQEFKLARAALLDHRERHGTEEELAADVERRASMTATLEQAWAELEEAKARAETAKEERARKLARGLDELVQIQARISDKHARIDEFRQKDPEGALAKLEAERAALSSRARAARARAEAIRLLEESLLAEKDRLTATIGEPVRERMQAWISYLLQDDSRLQVDENGHPAVIRTPCGRDIGFLDQSFGTREQVSILHRLAIADLVARESSAGVVLMLDDPFGHTDRGRRERMLDILTSEAEKRGHQILVFTCRPEDFEGVGTLVPIGRSGSSV